MKGIDINTHKYIFNKINNNKLYISAYHNEIIPISKI